jgi:ornithine cyclodeaminase/alanine dehydrogenase
MQAGKEILYLSYQDVAAVGPSMAETIAIVEGAFRDKGHGVTQLPAKTALHPLDEDAFIHAMPAWVPSSRAAGVKWVSGYPLNQQKGLPYIAGLLILNDPDTGIPLAVMDCAWITAQRTGAVSGIAARHLAPPGAATAALLGAGVQGRTQVRALATEVQSLREVRVFDPRQESADSLIAELGAEFPRLRLQPAAFPEEAVRGADIVVSAGPILKHPRPNIEKNWLKPGCLGLPVDFDAMWTGPALQLDRYLVDDLAQYRYYEQQGFFAAAPEPAGDLGDLLAGRCPGRKSEKERIISMNLGVAIADMPTARLVFERALASGKGQVLPL